MSRRHRVAQGQDLRSIARRYGFLSETLWELNPALRESRLSPNALLPGDIVEIPDLERKVVSASTHAKHRFVLRAEPLNLTIRLTRMGESRANEPYRLEADGLETISGNTDDDGWIREVLPARIRSLRLVLRWDERDEQHFDLDVGHLDPHDTATGVQGRLENLGYYFGRVDGDIGPVTAQALVAFQVANDLAPTGALDPATADAIRRRHESI